MTFRLRARGVAAILLDIEGTTTPIAFVHEVLFRFARRQLRAYLGTHAPGQSAAALAQLREEWQADRASATAPPAWLDGPEGAAEYVEWLMDQDRKSPGLKQLQGGIWAEGYRDGTLKGEVFADVPPALRRWRSAGIDVAIYSSGSVFAQKMLFSTTTYGDLTAWLTGFFDTAAGPKNAAASYRTIAASIGCEASGILFLSDAPAELDAAGTAGCQTLLAVRPGNQAVEPSAVRAIRSFDEITL